jgi:hypothetical protein
MSGARGLERPVSRYLPCAVDAERLVELSAPGHGLLVAVDKRRAEDEKNQHAKK